MKMAQYWEAQENRWHDKYIEAEGLIDQLENKIWEQASQIETLKGALIEITSVSKVYVAKGEDMAQALLTLLSSHRKIALQALGEENV